MKPELTHCARSWPEREVVAHARDRHVDDGRGHDRGHHAHHHRQQQQPAVARAVAAAEGMRRGESRVIEMGQPVRPSYKDIGVCAPHPAREARSQWPGCPARNPEQQSAMESPPPTTAAPPSKPKPRPRSPPSSRRPPSRRAYQCQCGRPVFLRNSQCLACQTPLGYVIESLGVVPLAPAALRRRRARHLHRVRRRRRQGLPPLRQPDDRRPPATGWCRRRARATTRPSTPRAWCPACACRAASRAPSPTCRSRATASCGASSSWPSAG